MRNVNIFYVDFNTLILISMLIPLSKIIADFLKHLNVQADVIFPDNLNL